MPRITFGFLDLLCPVQCLRSVSCFLGSLLSVMFLGLSSGCLLFVFSLLGSMFSFQFEGPSICQVSSSGSLFLSGFNAAAQDSSLLQYEKSALALVISGCHGLQCGCLFVVMSRSFFAPCLLCRHLLGDVLSANIPGLFRLWP